MAEGVGVLRRRVAWRKYKEKHAERYRIAARQQRRTNRLRAIQYLGGQCSLCEVWSTSDPDCLEFDHVPTKGQKRRTIASLLNCSWEVILIELQKCQLLCHEHHVEITYARRIGLVIGVMPAYVAADESDMEGGVPF